MTEPSNPHVGDVAVKVDKIHVEATDQHSEINTFINNNITVIQRGDRASPPRHKKAAPHHGNALHNPPGDPTNVPRPNLPGAIPPVVSFAADGDKVTTYSSRDGATATFREDGQNGGAVTLTLHDGKGTLTTHGDRRGFEFSKIDALGHVKSESITLDTYWKSPMQIGSVVDKVNCPDTRLKGTNVIPAITGDVTRDKLQQFGADHPELAATLNHVRLPATVSGGRQYTFSDALIDPSEFRACPPHVANGIVRK